MCRNDYNGFDRFPTHDVVRNGAQAGQDFDSEAQGQKRKWREDQREQNRH